MRTLFLATTILLSSQLCFGWEKLKPKDAKVQSQSLLKSVAHAIYQNCEYNYAGESLFNGYDVIDKKYFLSGPHTNLYRQVNAKALLLIAKTVEDSDVHYVVTKFAPNGDLLNLAFKTCLSVIHPVTGEKLEKCDHQAICKVI